jgi:hypothetical protein
LAGKVYLELGGKSLSKTWREKYITKMVGGKCPVKNSERKLQANDVSACIEQPPKLSSSSLHSLSSDKEFPAVTASTTKKYNIEVFVYLLTSSVCCTFGHF